VIQLFPSLCGIPISKIC